MKTSIERAIEQVVNGAEPSVVLTEMEGDGDYRKWSIDELRRLPVGSILVDKTKRAIIKIDPRPKDIEWHEDKEFCDYDARRKQPAYQTEYYTAKYVHNILQSRYPLKLLAK